MEPLFALMLAVTPLPGDFDIRVDNFTAERGISQIVMTVTNRTPRDAERVYVECVFMTEDERAIDIGRELIPSIPAGGQALGKAAIPTTAGVSKASCSVTRATLGD